MSNSSTEQPAAQPPAAPPAVPVITSASTTPVGQPRSDRPQVVVIGGGFGGMEAVKALKGKRWT